MSYPWTICKDTLYNKGCLLTCLHVMLEETTIYFWETSMFRNRGTGTLRPFLFAAYFYFDGSVCCTYLKLWNPEKVVLL
jgi:hypothetical protein